MLWEDKKNKESGYRYSGPVMRLDRRAFELRKLPTPFHSIHWVGSLTKEILGKENS